MPVVKTKERKRSKPPKCPCTKRGLKAKLKAMGSVNAVATDLGVERIDVLYWMDQHGIKAEEKKKDPMALAEAYFANRGAKKGITLVQLQRSHGNEFVRLANAVLAGEAVVVHRQVETTPNWGYNHSLQQKLMMA